MTNRPETISDIALPEAWLSDILECAAAEINDDTSTLSHPKWDSLAHASVMMFLAENYGVEITDVTISRFEKFSEIKSLDDEFRGNSKPVGAPT